MTARRVLHDGAARDVAVEYRYREADLGAPRVGALVALAVWAEPSRGQARGHLRQHFAALYLYLVRLVFYLLFELPAVGAELRGERERLGASALYRGLVKLAFDGSARAGLDAHVVHQ